MNDIKGNIKSGTVLMLSDGEYDEYGIVGIYNVLVDFNYLELLKTFSELNKEKPYYCYAIDFKEWLRELKIIEYINYEEIHL